MASRHQVTCINKTDRTSPHERIRGIGGKNENGTNWWLSEDDAIRGIKNGTYEFYVSAGGRTARVIIARSAAGREYLKTEADGERPDNLLSLPECPGG